MPAQGRPGSARFSANPKTKFYLIKTRLIEPEKYHIPVLSKEVVEFLLHNPELKTILDGTLGAGGHALALLEEAKKRDLKLDLVGLDLDRQALQTANLRLGRLGFQIETVNDSFRYLNRILDQLKIDRLDGVLLDLGLSSLQLENPFAGFSFQGSGPLDMRFDRSPESRQIRAFEIVNRWPEVELYQVFRDFGQERRASLIARAIVERRRQGPIETTKQLADLVSSLIPRHDRRHPATKIFQALRIGVNDELSALLEFMPSAIGRLSTGGRIVIISYHSLEDRIVKRSFKAAKEKNELLILTKKVIRPSVSEIEGNPKARSAKLRAAEKL